jgi:hypothetical protein
MRLLTRQVGFLRLHLLQVGRRRLVRQHLSLVLFRHSEGRWGLQTPSLYRMNPSLIALIDIVGFVCVLLVAAPGFVVCGGAA